MNLMDENLGLNQNSKKVITACIIGIVIIIFAIIGLLAFVTSLKGNTSGLTVDGKSYSINEYILNKDNVYYIGIEDLVKITNNGYSYKSGDKDVEDESKCYIINSYESTFFEVDSKQIYKVSEETNDIEYYTLEHPIIKENSKIYMPLEAVKIAANSDYTSENNKITISSIGYLESFYNREKTTTFTPDTSIVWETTYPNKKMLKESLVMIKDEIGNFGLAKVSYTTTANGKTNVTKVTTQQIITPKYVDINYIENYKQLIVETENGKGVIQLIEENGEFQVKTKVVPQYESIKPINENLYLVSETVVTTENEKNTASKKYGIIDQNGNTILPSEYDQIGLDTSKFTNNDLVSEYIIYEKYIPVKKDGLWGFVDTTGKTVIKLEYTGLGYTGTNANSNVLIIPELQGIVVKKDKSYGIINTSGESLIKCVLTRIYKDTVDGKEIYAMLYNEKKYNVIDYINAQKENNKTNNTTNNTTNTTTNKTNTTTNKTNTTTNTNKNQSNSNKNNTIVVKNTN